MNKPSEVKKHHCQQQMRTKKKKEVTTAAKHYYYYYYFLYYNFVSEKLDHLKMQLQKCQVFLLSIVKLICH